MENTGKKLYRSSSNEMIAGVCAGIANYFNVDPTIVRLAFLVMALAGGPGILLYFILWIIIPQEPV